MELLRQRRLRGDPSDGSIMRHRVRLVPAIVMTLLLALSSGAAIAQADRPKQGVMTDEARAHLSKGGKLYNDGAYDAALIEFQRAYDLSGNYKILYNLAQIGRA